MVLASFITDINYLCSLVPSGPLRKSLAVCQFDCTIASIWILKFRNPMSPSLPVSNKGNVVTTVPREIIKTSKKMSCKKHERWEEPTRLTCSLFDDIIEVPSESTLSTSFAWWEAFPVADEHHCVDIHIYTYIHIYIRVRTCMYITHTTIQSLLSLVTHTTEEEGVGV